MQSIDVSYFDTLSGGSGLIRLSVDGMQGLADWLSSHPGYLIRHISILGVLRHA